MPLLTELGNSFRVFYKEVAPPELRLDVRWMLDVLSGNLTMVAERLRKLASHNVAGFGCMIPIVLKGQRKLLSIPSSFQDVCSFRPNPATLWLANFQRRFATAELISTEHVGCSPFASFPLRPLRLCVKFRTSVLRENYETISHFPITLRVNVLWRPTNLLDLFTWTGLV